MIVRGLEMRRLFVAGAVVVLLAVGCGETGGEGSAPATATVTAATVTAGTAEATLTSDVAAPETAAAGDASGGDVTGAYFATTPLPAEFAELEHLLLATIDDNGAPAPLNGFLRPKASSAKDYVLVQPVLSGRNLTFTTAAVNGVHYTFSGAFTRLGNFAADPPPHDEVVLAGTLSKLRDGKQVATTPVSFGYQAGG
jgi:hypothetical protein